VAVRLRASAETPRPTLVASTELSAVVPPQAKRPSRTIYWADLKREVTTDIFDGAQLQPGNTVRGPAVIETTQTSVVVPPGRVLNVDRFGNFEIPID
jgi:N-methylhydantoinase A/oxoprolinase/acetone carboxylase beta subunit